MYVAFFISQKFALPAVCINVSYATNRTSCKVIYDVIGDF